jgi:uncharacterized membrane protein
LLALTVLWAIVNAPHIAVMLHIARPDETGKMNGFDPFPFVFFNLLLAILVSLQGPLIVMSQNRQSLKDRATAETDFKVNLKNEVNIESILRELAEFRIEASARLESLEKRVPPRPAGAPDDTNEASDALPPQSMRARMDLE